MPKKEEVLTEQEEKEFQIMLQLILSNGGGQTNDRGEETNYGITQTTYNQFQDRQCAKYHIPPPEQHRSVRNITKKEVDQIYRSQYYTRSHSHKVQDPNTRYQYFDMVVSHGMKTFSKIMKETTDIKEDFKVGKKTLSTINSGNQIEIQKKMAEIRKEYSKEQQKNSEQQDFQKGKQINAENQGKSITSEQLQQDQQLPQLWTQGLNQMQVGGIDISIDMEQLQYIRGINDYSYKFILDNQQNISLSDLATVLRVFTDPYIPNQNKRISFSLDPVLIENEIEFKEQEKVCWPDKYLNKNIIMDTEFVKVLFECDFQMKLMSLGVSEDGETPFQYPQELKERGLKPKYEFQSKNSDSQKQSLCRFWLAPDSCTYSYQNDKYIIEDIKVICQSKQMERVDDRLKDKDSQDPEEDNYQFAEKFTELYDLISQYYPCFKRLKQLFKSVVLGKWMYENGVQINPQILQKYLKHENNAPYFIPIMKYQRLGEKIETQILHTEEEKIEIIHQLLGETGLPNALINQLASCVPDHKETQIQQPVNISMGGVDPNCKNLIQKQPDANLSIKTYDDILNLSADEEADIPFLYARKCEDCSRYVENNLVMFNQKKCSIHNNHTCYICLQLIPKKDEFTKFLIMHGKLELFHSECLEEWQKEYQAEEYGF